MWSRGEGDGLRNGPGRVPTKADRPMVWNPIRLKLFFVALIKKKNMFIINDIIAFAYISNF